MSTSEKDFIDSLEMDVLGPSDPECVLLGKLRSRALEIMDHTCQICGESGNAEGYIDVHLALSTRLSVELIDQNQPLSFANATLVCALCSYQRESEIEARSLADAAVEEMP